MIEVVSGPPCSGKSTYIRNKAKKGDIIIDLDRIALSIATEDTPHHEYTQTIKQIAIQARQTIIQTALLHSNNTNIYIIDTNPTIHSKRVYDRYRATWTKLNTPRETCLERIQTQRPKHLQDTLIQVMDKYLKDNPNG